MTCSIVNDRTKDLFEPDRMTPEQLKAWIQTRKLENFELMIGQQELEPHEIEIISAYRPT